jgi:hypothetical protein
VTVAFSLFYSDNFREELSVILAAVRARNNNTLTGLTIPAIISKVDEFLKEKASKQGNCIIFYSVCSPSKFTRL